MKIVKIGKFIFAILIIISSIITAFQFIASKDWTKGLQTFASITTAATFFYEEFDEIYALTNRLKGWILNKTVNFSISFYTYNEEIDIPDIQKAFDNAIKKGGFVITEGRNRKIEDIGILDTIITTPKNLNIFCKISRDDVDSAYKIKLKFQISSREIAHSWDLGKEFRDNFLANLNIGERKRCDIEIDMSDAKINPFYKLTVRTINAQDVVDFRLSADVSDSLEIELHQYKLYATSSKISDLEKLIKEYVPLATVS